MISAKKLIKLAKKWQKLAAIRRKRITTPQAATCHDTDDCSTSSAVEKGHFVVYSMDQKRFSLPLNYLNKDTVRELFNLAEDEYGLPSNGPLILPCEAVILEYVISLMRQNVRKEVEKALMLSIANRRCSSTMHLHQEVTNHQLSICSF